MKQVGEHHHALEHDDVEVAMVGSWLYIVGRMLLREVLWDGCDSGLSSSDVDGDDDDDDDDDHGALGVDGGHGPL